MRQEHSRVKKPVNTANILGLGMRNVMDDYVLGALLGEGAFGVVRRCRNKLTNREFACKTVLKKQLRRRADVEDVRREVQILMMLSSHPNVAGLVAIYEDSDAVHLILELCEGGQLFDDLCSRHHISERDVVRIFRKMVEVVVHCHTLGIAHRDIKPENFLLSKKGPEGQVKAADFGLSQFVRPGKSFSSLVGSAFFVAPEVLLRKYGTQADVWSLGVCLYVFLTGQVPFEGNTAEEIFDKILHLELDYSGPRWAALSKPAKNLVQKMLVRDPSRRLTAQAVLQHTWMCQAAPDTPLAEGVLSGIRSFAGATRVQRATTLLAEEYLQSEDPEPMIATVLNDLEVDEGTLARATPVELKQSLHRAGLHISSGELSKVQDPSTEAPEVVAHALAYPTEHRQDLFRHLYQRLHPDEDGCISLDQLHETLAKYGITREDMLRFDKDGDGKISFEDFSSFLANNTHSLQEAVRRRWHTSPQKLGSQFLSRRIGGGSDDFGEDD